MRGVTAVAALALVAWGCSAPVTFEAGLAFDGVAVVDVVTGEVLPDRTVIVDGNRIVAVEPSSRVRLEGGGTRVDGAGRFLIPGLWDMHVHAIQPGGVRALPLFVANGVTGVRDMWGRLDIAATQRDAIGRGEAVGPRFIVAGNLVDGDPPWFPGANTVATPEAGRLLVDSLAAAGAAFIKVYSVLEPDVYQAILETAAERDLPVAGHVPFSVPILDAVAAGQVSMTHLFGLVEGCTSADAEIRSDRAEWVAARGTGAPNPFFSPVLYRRILEAEDPATCDAVLGALAEAGTWQAPTLALHRVFGTYTPERLEDPSLAWVPAPLRQQWESMGGSFLGTGGPDPEANRSYYERQAELVGLAHARGVPILAGTDTPNPFMVPGFSLPEELEVLAASGLSNLEALQTATLNPARFLGAEDSLGTIEVGRLADLVLLRANPLDQISNVREVEAVVADGRYFDRPALDERLTEAEPAGPGG